MEYRTLGRTGMRVSVLGFGAAEIGYEDAAQEDVDRIVRAACDSGVNVFDTAECYEDSEEKLGRALEAERRNVLIFTKCGHASGLDGEDSDPRLLAGSIERSLRRLRTEYVDLIQLHSCSADTLRAGDAIDVLRRAREAGKARFIGYSGDSGDAQYAVECGAFDALQTSVSIADQEALELTLPPGAARGMGVIAKRAIANAAWKYAEAPPSSYHHEYWRRLQKLDYEFLREPLREAVSTALRFTLAVPQVTMAVVGTKNPDRWSQNTRMLENGPFSAKMFERIRRRWREASEPGWVGQV